MVDETKSMFGRIDYFVNTAGVSPNTAWIVGLEMSQLWSKTQSLFKTFRSINWAATGIKG